MEQSVLSRLTSKVLVLALLAAPSVSLGLTFGATGGAIERANIGGHSTHLCTKVAPFFECCEDTTGASCDTPADECDPINGDDDCVDITYDTCAETASSDMELTDEKMIKWVCDEDFTTNPIESNSRWLWFGTFLDDTISEDPTIRCKYGYNTKATSGEVQFFMAAVAVNSASSSYVPSLSSGDIELDDVKATANRYAMTGWSEPVNIEDSNTATDCAGTACEGKYLKVFFTLYNTVSLSPSEPIKISGVICEVE